MNTEILGVVAQIALMVILAYPLGKYIARVYKGEKTWSDFMVPVERIIYKVCGIDPKEEMSWKQFLKALLILNAFWFFWGMVLLVSQGWLPLNPDGNGPQTPDQAFNTCYKRQNKLFHFHKTFCSEFDIINTKQNVHFTKVVSPIFQFCLSLHQFSIGAKVPFINKRD